MSRRAVPPRPDFSKSRQDTVDFSKVICNHFQEIATEEDVGPLVLAKHVKQIEATYTSNAARAEHIQTILDTFDINKISQEDRDRAQVFEEAFGAAMEQLPAFQQSKIDLIVAKQRAKEAKRAARKLELARPVYDEIEKLLEGFDHKELVLACEWQSNGYCIFDNGPSQEILGPLLSAPSSATKTKIAQVVRKVVEAYHLLDSQGLIGDKSAPRRLFHRLICSQDLPESHVALLKYCHTEMSSQGIIGAPKAYLIFLQFLRAGQIVNASLAHTFRMSTWPNTRHLHDIPIQIL